MGFNSAFKGLKPFAYQNLFGFKVILFPVQSNMTFFFYCGYLKQLGLFVIQNSKYSEYQNLQGGGSMIPKMSVQSSLEIH